jgi:D-amino-acid oxidase
MAERGTADPGPVHPDAAQRVTVVGAGIIGLTCALRLAEAGYAVDVLARDLPAETTSAVAGGLWLPCLTEPTDRVNRWARTGFDVLAGLATIEGAGVRLMAGHLLRTGRDRPPAWAGAMADVAPLTTVTEPAPGYTVGYDVTLPVVDLRRHLPWILARLEAAGGTLTRLSLAALPGRGVVVNCTGVAARALAADPEVRAVRGQVVLVRDPGLRDWWCDEGGDGRDPLYVLPRGDDVVVGGTAQDGDWSTAADPDVADRVLRRARDLVPALRGATVLGHRVGLRPARPAVRLDVERRPTRDDESHAVVHCYGHGGAGVTLAWGCALDVVQAVDGLTQTLL